MTAQKYETLNDCTAQWRQITSEYKPVKLQTISVLWDFRNFKSWTWLVCFELDIMPWAWENQLQVISGGKCLHCETYIIPTKNLSSTVFTIQPNINRHVSKLDFYQWELTQTANNRNRHLLLELSDINCKMTMLTVVNNIKDRFEIIKG